MSKRKNDDNSGDAFDHDPPTDVQILLQNPVLSPIDDFLTQTSPCLSVYEDQNDTRLPAEGLAAKAHPLTILVSTLANSTPPPPAVLAALNYIISWLKESTVFETPETTKAYKTAVGKLDAAAAASTLSEFSPLYFLHPHGFVTDTATKTHTLASLVSGAINLGNAAVTVTATDVQLERTHDIILATRPPGVGDYKCPQMLVKSGDANFVSSVVSKAKAHKLGQNEIYVDLTPEQMRVSIAAAIRAKVVPSFLNPLASLGFNARLAGGKVKSTPAIVDATLATISAYSSSKKLSALSSLCGLYDHLTDGLHPMKVEVLTTVPTIQTWLVPLALPRRPTSDDYKVVGASYCNLWTVETTPPKPDCYQVNPTQFTENMYWFTGFPLKYVSAVRATTNYLQAEALHTEMIDLLYDDTVMVAQKPSLAALDDYTKTLCELVLAKVGSAPSAEVGGSFSTIFVPFDTAVKPTFARNLVGMALLGFRPAVSSFMDSYWLNFLPADPQNFDEPRQAEAWAEAWMEANITQLVKTTVDAIAALQYPNAKYRVFYAAKDLASAGGLKSQIDSYINLIKGIADPDTTKTKAPNAQPEGEKLGKRQALQEKLTKLKAQATAMEEK